ncbi:MAG: hypothetical protein ACTSPD_10355 [Promethearchaeota archaeon]
MAIDKKELKNAIGSIGYDILDNIVSPICGIEGIIADLYLATLLDYTLGEDSPENDKIIKTICERYKLEYLDDENEIPPIYPDMSIALIALYILENGEY